MQYQNNGDSGGSATVALKQNYQTSEEQKLTEETFDEFLLQVNEESKVDFQNRIKEFDIESAPKDTDSSKFTSRSKLGLDDDIFSVYQNHQQVSKRPSGVHPLKFSEEEVHFDAFLVNSGAKTENQENDPGLMNKANTIEKLMQDTAELDKVININVSSNLDHRKS